jgi:hypothetical protein
MAGRAVSVAERCALLARCRTIAVVGVSADPDRPSHRIFAYLRERPGIAAVPVNPELDAVAGAQAYPTLAAYAERHGSPDLVNVFRRPSAAAQVARAAIAIGARAIWFQLGVASDDALRLADEAGLRVVAGYCIKVEWNRCDAQTADR